MEKGMSLNRAETRPDAIGILAGTIKEVNGTWMSTALTEEDDRIGAPGQQLRIAAAVVLARKYPDALLVPSGGIGYDHPLGIKNARPFLAEVMRDELLEHGVSPSRIILETGSNSTYQQLQEIRNMLVAHKWDHVALVTNRWHVPRTEAIVVAKFPDMVRHVTLIPAEEVLLEDSPEVWKAGIESAYRSPFLKERIEKELEGIRQIKAGTYNFR